MRKWPSSATLSQKETRAYMNDRTRVTTSWNAPWRQCQPRQPTDTQLTGWQGRPLPLEPPSFPPYAKSRYTPPTLACPWQIPTGRFLVTLQGNLLQLGQPRGSGRRKRIHQEMGLGTKRPLFQDSGISRSSLEPSALTATRRPSKRGKKEIMHFTFLRTRLEWK